MIPTCKDINCPQVLFYNIHTFGLKLIHMTYCEVELKLIMEYAQYFLMYVMYYLFLHLTRTLRTQSMQKTSLILIRMKNIQPERY